MAAYEPVPACRLILTARAQFKREYFATHNKESRKAAGGSVNRTMLLEYQKLVLHQVAYYEQRIAQQKQLIEGLSSHDQAMLGAKDYLIALEAALALNVAHRDLVKQELAAADPE